MGSVRIWLGLCVPAMLAAQAGIVSTVAGQTPVNGAPVRGFSGDGGAAAQATLALASMTNTCTPDQFEQTSHIAIDSQGNIYFADSDNQRIRRIDPSGTITTIAGNGVTPPVSAPPQCQFTGSVADGASATSAQLFNPADVLSLANGNVLIADQQNNRIRQVTPAGAISTIVGNGIHNFFAPGNPATASAMDWPSSVAVDANGLLYFAELHSNRVGKIGADGKLIMFAGTGFPTRTGFPLGDNGPANRATLTKPAGIAFDRSGNLLIADTGNHRIRRVGLDGTITTIAGTGQQSFCGDGGPAAQACLNTPMDVKTDALGNIYIADTGNHRIRRIDSSGNISTVAGTGVQGRGADNVDATTSALNFPCAIALDANNDLYIVDWQNYLIRKVTFGGAPAVFAGGIVSGSSFTTPVAPGGFISIFGTSLAPSTTAAAAFPLPPQIAGVSVEVNGAQVPLYAVSPGQINAQLPYETAVGTATAVVVAPAGRTPAAQFTVAPTAIGILTIGGTKRAVVQNQDSSINSPDNSEARGNAIVCYVTGLGAVSPPVAAGQSAPFGAPIPANNTVTATIGGVPAQVFFAGLTAGFAGLGQVNIFIPAGVAPDPAAALVLSQGGQTSQTATVSIR
ncbi:MAG: hypothetical protein LAP87_05565 [Acidobacteriia bacterium]|nr:hypothetical protein [Terriglobia bacterium]